MFHKVVNREFGLQKQKNQSFYTQIYPNKTLYNQIFNDSIRKFSSCGNFLICFSKENHGIAVYLYKPPGINNPKLENYFTLKYEVYLAPDPQVLCTDFLLFTRNKKHMIVVAAATCSNIVKKYPNSLSCITPLDDITFYVIEIASGIICDKKVFTSDYIYLANHSGCHLFNDYFGITSVQNQCIYIYVIKPDGKFVHMLDLGWHCNADDQLVLDDQFRKEMHHAELDFQTRILFNDSHQVPSDAGYSYLFNSTVSIEIPVNENKNVPLPGLVQKTMAFLYHKALESNTLGHFYQSFSYFSSLVMWRMQFISESLIMIKLGSINNICGRTNDNVAYTAFFVFYCLESKEVVGVYENSSPELLRMFETNPCFTVPSFPDEQNNITTVSNNKYARELIKKHMYAVLKAKNGGKSQSIKRILSALPINPQSFSESPYFNLDLFSFDEKVINSCDRIRNCTDYPVKFFDRKTGKLVFKLKRRRFSSGRNRNCLYVFHPTDPLVISIQSVDSYTSSNNAEYGQDEGTLFATLVKTEQDLFEMSYLGFISPENQAKLQSMYPTGTNPKGAFGAASDFLEMQSLTMLASTYSQANITFYKSINRHIPVKPVVPNSASTLAVYHTYLFQNPNFIDPTEVEFAHSFTDSVIKIASGKVPHSNWPEFGNTRVDLERFTPEADALSNQCLFLIGAISQFFQSNMQS
ncbi:acid phosphatase det1 [Boothiomyces sp. JEL0866]|nr:acid phosphatase det1 [Boothiomyces sp. JEL0866]